MNPSRALFLLQQQLGNKVRAQKEEETQAINPDLSHVVIDAAEPRVLAQARAMCKEDKEKGKEAQNV